MKLRDDFCIFILTYGRPDNVKTIKTMLDAGYTGEWYLVVDDTDETVPEYIARYGEDKVLIFNKKEVKKNIDVMDNFNKYNVILYSRNVCFDFAKKLGFRFFLQFDDDYTAFHYRRVKDGRLISYNVQNLDYVVEQTLQFLNNTPITTVAFAQGGDLIGGALGSGLRKPPKRKAMNSFFCDTQKPFKFLGTINEDVNAYTWLGSRGYIFLTVADVSLVQMTTQKNSGGMTDIYKLSGTYVKSFYTIMCMPSAVKITMMGESNKRLHHQVRWNNCVPKIIDPKYKKK